MKQQILEVLDKSTNNGMKVDEIMEITREWLIKTLNEAFLDGVDPNAGEPAILDDLKIFMVGKLR